jgi:hypothetical protein
VEREQLDLPLLLKILKNLGLYLAALEETFSLFLEVSSELLEQ